MTGRLAGKQSAEPSDTMPGNLQIAHVDVKESWRLGLGVTWTIADVKDPKVLVGRVSIASWLVCGNSPMEKTLGIGFLNRSFFFGQRQSDRHLGRFQPPNSGHKVA